MKPAPPRVVLHVLAMRPDKRGPVESQLAEMGRQLGAAGSRQVCVFAGSVPDWYAGWLAEGATEPVVVDDPGGDGLEQVLEVAERVRPDVAHLHFVRQQPLIRRLRAVAGCRVVVTEHSFRAPPPAALARRLVRYGRTRQVDRFIAVSEFIRGQVRRDYLAREERIVTVLNGIDLGLFHPPADKAALRRRILGLGPEARVAVVASHLHPAKRIDLVVRAMPDVVASVPDAQLVIAGGGSEREPLSRLIEELGVGSAVRILSGDNRVEDIYGAADVGVSASSGEGLSGSTLEALACGLPFVAAPRGGQTEAIRDGETGLLLAADTATAMAGALIGLLGDPERTKAMGARARRDAEERFDVRRAARQTIEVYERLG